MVCLEKNFKVSASPVANIVLTKWLVTSSELVKDADIDDDVFWTLINEPVKEEEITLTTLSILTNDSDIDLEIDDDSVLIVNSEPVNDADIDDDICWTSINEPVKDADIDDDIDCVITKVLFTVVSKASLPIPGWLVQ